MLAKWENPFPQAMLQNYNRKLDLFDWYIMADPGNAGSAFAVLFIAYAAWIPKAFFLDEIYETEGVDTTVGRVGKKIITKAATLYPLAHRWKCYYDVAALWFANNFHGQFCDENGEHGNCGLAFMPVEKNQGDKEEGIDTLNDLYLNQQIEISTQCPNTIWEFDNFVRDAKGRIPKRNDHQIDNSRYFVKMSGIVAGKSVDGKKVVGRVQPTKKRERRYVSLEHDLKMRRRQNLFGAVLAKYGEND